jgi:hypothetical protein
MTLPGFTAEVSLHKTSSYFRRSVLGPLYGLGQGAVVFPQQPGNLRAHQASCELYYRICLSSCRLTTEEYRESCQVECWNQYTSCMDSGGSDPLPRRGPFDIFETVW